MIELTEAVKIRDFRPELLLPVGNMEMCMAAIHNGADAIYVGMPGFNARGRSYDHEMEQIKEMIDLCHLYGVKVHLAFNILIFEDEFPLLEQKINEVVSFKPDSFIVQDLGLAVYLRQKFPEIVLHASTQMTITNFEAIDLLSDLQFKRVVLGREVSLDEIRSIKAKTQTELEVFVHGALCVAYSGQCNTSEGIGGRSANRGQCAQSCRFQYDLYVDENFRDLGDKKYLLSPKDLCGLEEVPKLMELQIESFKIEGRLKSPEYVGATASEYRNVINNVLTSNKSTLNSSTQDLIKAKNNLATTYSRGFYSGWLHGVEHQKLVDGKYSAHRGVYVGKLLRIQNAKMILSAEENIPSHFLKSNQGLLFVFTPKHLHLKMSFEGRFFKPVEWGGKIFSVIEQQDKGQKREFLVELLHKNKDSIALEWSELFKNGVNANNILLHYIVDVYVNSDEELNREINKKIQDKNLKKKIPLYINYFLTKERFLKAQFVTYGIDRQKHLVEVMSAMPLESAKTRGLDREKLKSVWQGLAGTVYDCRKIMGDDSQLNSLYILEKDLKEMRQKAIIEMNESRLKNPRLNQNQLIDERVRNTNQLSMHKLPKNANEFVVLENEFQAKINLLLRNKKQVDDFLSFMDQLESSHFYSIILDFEFGKDYKESVEKLKTCGLKVFIATNRILKPGEYHHFKVIERANPDGVLIRNLGALQYFSKQKFELVGDFSLNVSNHLSGLYLLSKGLKTVSASYDLNNERLRLLALKMPPSSLEITVHQYMPSFHMEHCVFAAFLSQGSSYRDCGKPCEKHEVKLKDQFGNEHFIKADMECRNTMYNAEGKSFAAKILEYQENGVNRFRIEALNETGESLYYLLKAYVEILENQYFSPNDFKVNILKSMKKDPDSSFEMGMDFGLKVDNAFEKGKWIDRKKSK